MRHRRAVEPSSLTGGGGSGSKARGQAFKVVGEEVDVGLSRGGGSFEVPFSLEVGGEARVVRVGEVMGDWTSSLPWVARW